MKQNGTQTAACCRSKENRSEGARNSCACSLSVDQAIVMTPRLLTLTTHSPELVGNGRQATANFGQYGRAKEAPGPPPPRIG